MSKVIVSNTGPLITLEKLPDGFLFIQKMYAHVIIPKVVANEVSENYSSFEDYLEFHKIKSFIQIKDYSKRINVDEINRLDEGEIAAISLAYELQAELLIEELKGRSIARLAGIGVSGIAGKIGFASLQGIIKTEEAKEKLTLLLQSGRINRAVYQEISKML